MRDCIEKAAWRARSRILRAEAGPPSFASAYAASRRIGRIARDMGGHEPVWDINPKLAAYAWADRLGLRRPRVLGEHRTAAEIDPACWPDRVVVKPVRGAGGKGVFLLEYRDGTWWDLRRAGTICPERVSAALAALARSGEVSHEVLVEDMVLDPRRPGQAPVDWKFYTFFGEVSLVLARASRSATHGRTTIGWRIFDHTWQDLGRDAYPGHEQDLSIQVPDHADELMACAALISAAVPRPFLRADLFEDREGPVFGEITPQPGGRQRFRRDIDRKLGAMWEESQARLQVRAAVAGTLTPSDRPLPESAVVLVRQTAEAHSAGRLSAADKPPAQAADSLRATSHEGPSRARS